VAAPPRRPSPRPTSPARQVPGSRRHARCAGQRRHHPCRYLRLVEGPITKAIARGRLGPGQLPRAHCDVPLRIVARPRLGPSAASTPNSRCGWKMSGWPTPPDGRIDNPHSWQRAADHRSCPARRSRHLPRDPPDAFARRRARWSQASRPDAGTVKFRPQGRARRHREPLARRGGRRLGALGLGDRVRVERSSEVVRDPMASSGMPPGVQRPAITVRRSASVSAWRAGHVALSRPTPDHDRAARTWTGDWNNRQAPTAIPQSLLAT
jgi:hypothetical protein